MDPVFDVDIGSFGEQVMSYLIVAFLGCYCQWGETILWKWKYLLLFCIVIFVAILLCHKDLDRWCQNNINKLSFSLDLTVHRYDNSVYLIDSVDIGVVV